MKSFLLILAILSSLIIINSCACNNSKNKKDKVQQNDTIKPVEHTYNVDSATQEVAVLVFNSDGNPDYIIDNPSNIFRKTNSGLEYRFVTNTKSKTYPKVGDVIYIDMTYKTEKDSIVFKTSDIDKNFKMRLNVPSHQGGCIEEAFMMLKEGDSAIFKIDAYNFFKITQKKINLPHYAKNGAKLIFNIKMKKIQDGTEYVKQNSEMISYYINQENSLIERYLLGFDFPTTKTSSGLRIMTIKRGSGKKAFNGNTVSIHYTAGFIDGGVFDSTIERNEAFSFVLGKSDVIQGLDEGIANMNIGDHCIFVIPFRLAYGENKHGSIPPYSTLVFEVELLDAK